MPRRVAFITRRYWPLVGVAEHVASDLVTEFRRLGVDTTVVTAQWEPHWPAHLCHRENRVVRLPSPKSTAWGTFRYMRALRRWLVRHRDELDAVIVSRLQYDAFAAVRTLAGGDVPVILRNETAGEAGDAAWHEGVPFGRRMMRRIVNAHALIAPTHESASESRQVGFPEDRVVRIPNGVPAKSPVSIGAKQEARLSLAEANHDLAAHPRAPVALYVGELQKAERLMDLVQAFRLVVQRNPNAHLWIIGDGPHRQELYRDIVDLGLHHHILMPGGFDDYDDLIVAADLYVSPGDQDSLAYAALKAMSHGKPVVAADTAGNRRAIRHGESGWLAPVGNAAAWAEAIAFLMERPETAVAVGQVGRAQIENGFRVTQTAEAHLQLVESLLENSSTKKIRSMR